MNYQKLFNHMFEKHGILLIESEMQEICNIVNDIQQPVSGTKLNNICNNCGFVKGTRDYITSGCEHENGFHSIT